MDFFEKTKASFLNHQNKGNRFSYPLSLKKDAVKLLAYYDPKILSKELGISLRTLTNWGKDQCQFIAKTKTSSAFIPIKLENTPMSAEQKKVTVTLKLPNNLELILPEQSAAEIARFTSNFIKEFSLCSI